MTSVSQNIGGLALLKNMLHTPDGVSKCNPRLRPCFAFPFAFGPFLET